MKVTSNLLLLEILSLSLGIAYGQVCSPPGQLCTRTTDCCKGCCEAHTCVDRSFPCSTDLIQQPGYNSCVGYYCPVGQLCYLREVCPPENPCPRIPFCRKVDTARNYSDWSYQNSSVRTLSNPMRNYWSITVIIVGFMSAFFL